MIQKLILPMEVKDATPEGKFTGLASVYGEVDLGGDVVERGAFKKNLEENPVVPILWQHQSKEAPIGSGTIRSTKDGLAIDAQLDMEDPLAAFAFRKLKLGLLKGLSIGFNTITDEVKNGVRHLKEVQLWEVSIVTFPMCLGATVTSLKQMVLSHKGDFNTELEAAQTWAACYMILDALQTALSSIVWEDGTPEEKVASSQESISQFTAAYLEALPKYLALREADSGMYCCSISSFEKKEGKDLSAARSKLIETATTNLQALLVKAAKGTLRDPAAEPGDEPLDNKLVPLFQSLKESFQWNRQ